MKKLLIGLSLVWFIFTVSCTGADFVIIFDGNEATNGSMEKATVPVGEPFTLPVCSFEKEYASFIGWNTKSDGSGLSYEKEMTFFPTGDLTFYAQWQAWEQVATPIFSLESNSFHTGEDIITLSCTTEGAIILYKINDGEYVEYEESGIILNEKSTLVAKAEKEGMIPSSETEPTVSYYLTFHGNGETSGVMTQQVFLNDVERAITKNDFAKAGATWASWNTQPDGLGVTYLDKQLIELDANMTMYAQWQIATPVVAFEDNAQEFKGATTFTIICKTEGVTIQYKVNNGEWETYNNSSVTIYETSTVVAKATQTNMQGSAESTPVTCTEQFTVTFYGNENTSGSMSPQTFTDGISDNLKANAFRKTNATWLRWSTMADGNGVNYDDEKELNLEDDLEIFAIWRDWTQVATPVVTVKDNATHFKGSTTFTVTCPTDGASISYKINSGSWQNYTKGSEVTISNTSTIVAKATKTEMITSSESAPIKVTEQFTLTFNGNGSTSGVMESQTFTDGVKEAIDENLFKRTSYDFAHWSKHATSGSYQYFNNKGEITLTDNLTLYARWKKWSTVVAPTVAIDNSSTPSTLSFSSTTDGAGFSYKLNDETDWTPFTKPIELDGTLLKVTVQATKENFIASSEVVKEFIAFTYLPNGGEGTQKASYHFCDERATLSNNFFTKEGYDLKEWNTQADGGGTAYTEGQIVKKPTELLLFAIWKVLSPVVTPNGGQHDFTSDITITSPNSSASLYYTIVNSMWGEKPTSSSTPISSGSTINLATLGKKYATTVKVIAIDSANVTSEVVVANFKDKLPVPTSSVVSGEFIFSNPIYFYSHEYPWVNFYYTLDGSEPTEKSLQIDYDSEKLHISSVTANSCILKVKAFKSGHQPSDSLILELDKKKLAFFTPDSGPWDFNEDIAIVPNVNGAKIYWSFNSDVSDRSTLIENNRLNLNSAGIAEDTPVYLRAYREGCVESDVVERRYRGGAKQPNISYTSVVDVFPTQATATVSLNAEERASIYYTIDGTPPTTSSAAYSNPFEVSVTNTNPVTIKAIAIKEGLASSIKELKLDIKNLGYSLLFVEGGTFDMGQPNPNIDGEGWSANEQPVHSVTLSSFYMGKYEVTQKEYREVMDFDPCATAEEKCGIGDNYPVYYISFYRAIAYCNKLSLKMGLTPVYAVKGVDFSTLTHSQIPALSSVHIDWENPTCDWTANGYRLPTEAEWEYAARGGMYKISFSYSGSNDISEVAWCRGNSLNKTHLVGKKKANALGLYDMSGNVEEWCWDWYGSYNSSASTNPERRVIRGGEFSSRQFDCRVFARTSSPPTTAWGNNGFRIVRNVN